MPILYLILDNKRWTLIVVLTVLWIAQAAYTNHLSGQLKEADAKCIAKVQEIEQTQLKALAEKQNKINEVSADYEAEKSKQRVKVEQVTREVQKIIDRPVYLNRCIDADGLRQINSLINTSSASEPDAAM